jgi:hypothetical protein
MTADKKPASRRKSPITEMKYSLPEMLIEVEEDRENSAFGREMVEQGEIEKLFKRKTKGKRVKRRK